MISTETPPDLYWSKGKLSCSCCSKIYHNNEWHNLLDKAYTRFLKATRILLCTHTLLTEKYKQKLFGYKSFYLFYYLWAKTYSRHCVDRKCHCINKFYKVSHIGLFCRWRKMKFFLSNEILLEKLGFNIRALFRIKPCPLNRKTKVYF